MSTAQAKAFACPVLAHLIMTDEKEYIPWLFSVFIVSLWSKLRFRLPGFGQGVLPFSIAATLSGSLVGGWQAVPVQR
jgi:hypothetical protein